MSTNEPPLRQDYPGSKPSGNGGAKVAIGCGIGCLAVVIVVAIFAVIGYNIFKKKTQELVTEYTSDAAVEISEPDVDTVQIENAVLRFDNFRNALANNTDAEPLILSADDINALIYHHQSFQELAGKTFVSIEDNKLGARVSFNLDDFPMPIKFLQEAMKGRFLNGDAVVTPSLRDGRLALFLEALTVNGQSIPEEFMKEMRKENLLQDADLEQDKDIKAFLEKVKEIKIEYNKLHIVPTSAAAQSDQ